MELSELTTDDSIAAQPHQVFLPGCFVVLQGISGDGLANTIETSPEYYHTGDEDVHEESKDAPSLEEDHFRPNLSINDGAGRVHGPTSNSKANPSLMVSQMVATHQNLTCALNNPSVHTAAASSNRPVQAVTEVQSEASPPTPSPPEDSFVVVGSEHEPNTPTRIRMYASSSAIAATSNRENRRKQSSILEWNQHRIQSQRLSRQEWHLQQQQQQHPSHQSSAAYTKTSNTPQPDWWLDPETGYLAVYDALTGPDKRIISSLAPGTTVTAQRLYTMDSETLQIIHIDGDDEEVGGDQPPLAPSIGVVQFLEVRILLPNSNRNKNKNNDQTAAPSSEPNWITDQPTVGYCVYSVNGYAFLVPGIASLYLNPQVWWWRVTCKVGAFLRQGLELSSDHHGTIPYGSFVQVTRKTVNRMGLSRLLVVATVMDGGAMAGERQQVGWCSEFLNPLSGQRGHVVQPLPFVVPALYRVTLPEGAVIRADVELSSRQIGHAPCGTLLTIVQRRFSEHPQDQCVERLKLAGGRESGWISVRLNQSPPHDKCVVELVGPDPRFEPNQPGDFHWQVLEEEGIRQRENTTMSRRSSRASLGDLSSVDEDNSSEGMLNIGLSGNNNGLRRRQQVENCLICLTEERNATIVHGETGHIACCLVCARILKARGDRCPVCRLEIDSVIQHFWA